jgi:hypothetical protein
MGGGGGLGNIGGAIGGALGSASGALTGAHLGGVFGIGPGSDIGRNLGQIGGGAYGSYLQSPLGPAGILGPALGGMIGGGAGGDNPGFQIDYAGRPVLGNFTSIIDPATGMPKSQYQTQNNLNTQALEAARGEALRPAGEMSKWRQLAQSDEMNRAAQSAASGIQQAQNQLAMQGGLRGGASERLAAQGMQGLQRTQQNISSSLAGQDEQNRQRWLQMQPGMELQAAQYGNQVQDTNIGRALGDITQNRAWDLSRYQEAMRAWAAAQQAAAAPQAQDRGFVGNILNGIGL